MNIQRDNPTEIGVYVCYVKLANGRAIIRVLLRWNNYKWSYLGSDLAYNSEVVGYIGPLPEIEMNAKQTKYAIGITINGTNRYTDGPFASMKQTLESFGNTNSFIFRLEEGKVDVKLRKWDDERCTWLRAKKRKK